MNKVDKLEHSGHNMPDDMMNAHIRQCVCGSTTWIDVKTRDPSTGKMPVHGKLACAICGAAKFASHYVQFPGETLTEDQKEKQKQKQKN